MRASLMPILFFVVVAAAGVATEVAEEGAAAVLSDWPRLLIIGGMILMVIIRGGADRTKNLPRRKQKSGKKTKKSPIDFEIPTIKGAPRERADDGVYREEPADGARHMAADAGMTAALTEDERAGRENMARTKEAVPEKIAPAPRRPRAWSLAPSSIRDAFILAEVVGKPRAMRRR